MAQPTKSEAIKNFLTASTHADLANRYSLEMECQVNVAQDGGKRIDGDFRGRQWHGFTDDITTWKPIRIPYNAATDPSFDDSIMSFDLAAHAEGIGMTGWNWARRESLWVGFDFDAITGHSTTHKGKLTDKELQIVQSAACEIPWVSVRRSTSGNGLHLYVDLEPVETANHSEHAALARSIIGMMSGLVGFDFHSKVDVCVPADTWIFTAKGPAQVKELIGKATRVVVDGNIYDSTGFFSTGQKQVFELVTTSGYRVKATDNHRFLTNDGQWREIKNLRPGYGIQLQCHKNIEWDGTGGSWEDGYILGQLFGDGHFVSRQYGLDYQHQLEFFPNDHCLVDFVANLFPEYPNISRNSSNAYEITSPYLEELRNRYGLDVDKNITSHLESESSDFLAGFVSAFFDTDGNADCNHTHVELSQSNLLRLEAIQRILLRFGIRSRINKEREAGQMTIQDRVVNCKAKYVLTIGRENVLIFNERIGFKHPVKKRLNQQNIDRILKRLYGKRKLATESFQDTIKSITPMGVMEVFDINVDKVHAFDANGFTAHNCGGNMWVWHRKMRNTQGLTLIKEGEVLRRISDNWREHIPVIKNIRAKTLPSIIEESPVPELDKLFDDLTGQRTNVQLDEDHKKLVAWLNENNCHAYWDQDRWMLVCHTADLKKAHDDLGLRGIFETATRQSSAYNCFAFPWRKGAWAIRRFSPGVQEHSSWSQDGSGWTQCYYNRDPDLATAAKSSGGDEHAKGGFVFRHASDACAAASLIGVTIPTLPPMFAGRPAKMKESKDGRLVIEINQESHDKGGEGLPGWIPEGKVWSKIFNANLRQPSEVEAGNYDDVIRHIVSTAGEDCGWTINTAGTWVGEPINHVKLGLQGALGLNPKEVTSVLGAAVLRHWRIVCKPFQPEYPGDREWNRKAAQFVYNQTESRDNLQYGTWMKVLNHIGRGLDDTVKVHGWCRSNGILNGADYLKCWIASLFQKPTERLPYLFLYSPEQNAGKSILYEALEELMTHGVARADQALVNTQGFNGELAGAVLCVVEETDCSSSKYAYNRIKDWTTAKMFPVHPKGETPYTVINTTHWIQSANSAKYCPVMPGDTRITMIRVKPLEPQDLIPKTRLLEMLRKEAPDFMAEIMNLEIPPSNDRLNVPVLVTSENTEAQKSNMTLVETFCHDYCHEVDGEMIRLSEFYQRFSEWCDAGDLNKWTKHYTSANMPPQYYKGRLPTDGQFYFGNISWEPRSPEQGIKPRLIIKGDKLVPMEED